MGFYKGFKIYSLMPVWMQNAACSAAGVRMRRARYGKVFREKLDFLEKSQWWSLEELTCYQNAKLQEIITHAYETVPYYREIFDQRRLKPGDIKGKEDLPQLPLLTKQIVRQRFKELISQSWPNKRIAYVNTGGTTGTALRLACDIDTQQMQWAVVWRHRRRFGVRVNDPFVVFAGRPVVPISNMKPPIWRRNLPMHQTYVSVHHMTVPNMPVLYEYLQQRKVKYYCGYPSGIYLLADYMLENNLKLKNPPAVIFTGSETLLPHQRRVISQAFGCPVADFYGASEYCGIISECEEHSLHLDMEFGAIELLPLDHYDPHITKIVWTGLSNPVMPLIRYEIGDLAAITDKICSCGRHSPTVDRIDGRIESYIITPDGRRLGRLDFLYKSSKTIREAQMVQEQRDKVKIKLATDESYSPQDEASLLRDLRGYLGAEIRIEFEYVDQIPREPNGKFRQIVSRVFEDKYATL